MPINNTQGLPLFITSLDRRDRYTHSSTPLNFASSLLPSYSGALRSFLSLKFFHFVSKGFILSSSAGFHFTRSCLLEICPKRRPSFPVAMSVSIASLHKSKGSFLSVVSSSMSFVLVRDNLPLARICFRSPITLIPCFRISGQTGLGKSTLINTIFAAHLIDSKGRLAPDEPVRSTTEIQTVSHSMLSYSSPDIPP